MKYWAFRFSIVAFLGLVACGEEAAPPPLGPEEQALVDAYVRVTVLQALHDRAPDSSLVALQNLVAEVDSMALRRALERLSRDPMRWELVYSALASRLEELESTPALWWSVARGDSLPPAHADSTQDTAPVRVPIPSEHAPDH